MLCFWKVLSQEGQRLEHVGGCSSPEGLIDPACPLALEPCCALGEVLSRKFCLLAASEAPGQEGMNP